MTLNEKIIQVLKSHPEGGETFFNALDCTIRSDLHIGESFIDWVLSDCPNSISIFSCDRVGVIVTGRFGHFIISNFADKLCRRFSDIIVVNGNLREGEPAEIFKESLPCSKYIMLDDSYYSGMTVDAIRKALLEISPHAVITKVYVIYDGSKSKGPTEVKAMYRYYGKGK